jgi:voltage-gated potassium channel
MSKSVSEMSPTQQKLYRIIFGYESEHGKLFDLVLIITIMASVLAVILDSVASINEKWHGLLYILEWGFTVLFTLEYVLRLYCTPSTKGYAFSFFGLVDLFSILPTYIAFLWPGSVYLIVIRSMRVLRVFRILKLARYMGEANLLVRALLEARHKIFVFLYGLLILIIIFGSLMFLVEGQEHGFDNIPKSIYWAIVTITTVGYGDIAPQTAIGQFIAAAAMVVGYAIIAVPFGIISSEIWNVQQDQKGKKANWDALMACNNCGHVGHDRDAKYCHNCGVEMTK